MTDLSRIKLLKVSEVATVMRVSKMTVYRMIHSGELPAVKMGRSFRVAENVIDEARALTQPDGDLQVGVQDDEHGDATMREVMRSLLRAFPELIPVAVEQLEAQGYVVQAPQGD